MFVRRFPLTVLLLAALGTACSATPPPLASPDRGTARAAASSIHLTQLLPDPYPTGSAEARAELEQMLAIQAERTPARVALARADADASVFRFADALGSPAAFVPERLPRVAALFAEVLNDEGVVVGEAKDRFDRSRPCRVEPRLTPVLACPPNASYPSGHAAFGFAAALVLADMLPEKRAAILERARVFAQSRVVAGVHYPSDIEAGRVAGILVAAFLFASPQFRAEEAAARRELRTALALPE
jgi:acid phosphatase (class A)